MKLHLCHYDYLPYPAKRTLQIGSLFIGRHFPGCSTWSLDISTQSAVTCLSLRGPCSIGDGWKDMPYLRSLLARWTQITLHLGPLLVTICLSRTSKERYENALIRAHVTI
jgi:hypothetical protein